MLFKIIGSIIVILSCSFLGFVLSGDCSKRPRQLRELQSLLQMFENQISYLSDIITEAFERIGRVGRNDMGIFFTRTVEILKERDAQSASEAWEKAVRQCIRTTALNKEDEEIMLSFGKLLGNTDIEGQIKNIRLAVGQLALQEKKAEESRKKNENMYRSLGMLGGLAVVIVLL
jgi:stage III sporulation protein AB